MVKNTALSFFITILVIALYFLIKNEITYKNRSQVIDAIHHYEFYELKVNCKYSTLNLYDEIEPYEKTLNRWWDWGYKRIVSKELYEKIKPYLKGE